MEELNGFGEVAHAAAGDGRIVWAAQGQPDGTLGPGVRAWRHGSAVAVASPDVSGRDRLAVLGRVDDATPLLRRVLDAVGPAYRVFGPAELVTGLVERISGLGQVGDLHWMETTSLPPADVTRQAGAEWLDDAGEKAATALFDGCFPRSYAQPGRKGVRRWAGVFGDTDGSGREPVAVAAEAWSGSGCGFMAGVVTHPAARGRGLSQAVCGFVLGALVTEFGRAALMAHADNAPALAAYERLGMTRRPLRATSVTQT